MSWLAIIPTCLAKIGILVPARGDCGLGGNFASKARHGGSRRGYRQPAAHGRLQFLEFKQRQHERQHRQLYTDPATAFVAEFVGVMNRIPGELQAGDQVTVLGSAIPVRGHRPVQSAVDVLVRPEGLRLEVVENGNGIVTTRTFLGSVTRVGVQLSGDVAVQVDRPSAEAAALAPGASVAVSLPAQPVLVAARRVS